MISHPYLVHNPVDKHIYNCLGYFDRQIHMASDDLHTHLHLKKNHKAV